MDGVLWRPLRQVLDVGAFGINAFVANDVGDDVVEDHAEEMLGLEEVYVVLAGRATFTLGEERLDAPAGTVVFVRDPALRRHAGAEERGTSVLAVGGPARAGSRRPARGAAAPARGGGPPRPRGGGGARGGAAPAPPGVPLGAGGGGAARGRAGGGGPRPAARARPPPGARGGAPPQ